MLSFLLLLSQCLSLGLLRTWANLRSEDLGGMFSCCLTRRYLLLLLNSEVCSPAAYLGGIFSCCLFWKGTVLPINFILLHAYLCSYPQTIKWKLAILSTNKYKCSLMKENYHICLAKFISAFHPCGSFPVESSSSCCSNSPVCCVLGAILLFLLTKIYYSAQDL